MTTARERAYLGTKMPIVVSFVSQKGGVGKSTLARALLAVASHVMRVRLADLDPYQASVMAWEKARESTHRKPTCEVVAYASAAEGISASSDVELLIIDTPARATRETVWIAEHSHLVVQPTGPSSDDLRPAVLTFHELVRAGIPRERLVMAICRTLSAAEEETTRAYLESAGYEVLAGSVPERIAYREAQNRGHAVTETPKAALNKQADKLMEALLTRVTSAIELQAQQRRKTAEKKR